MAIFGKLAFDAGVSTLTLLFVRFALATTIFTIVLVIRYAVVTQACAESPLSLSAMVRIEVATIVWSSAARNIPSMSPVRIVTIWLCVRFAPAYSVVVRSGAPSSWTCVVMRSPCGPTPGESTRCR